MWDLGTRHQMTGAIRRVRTVSIPTRNLSEQLNTGLGDGIYPIMNPGHVPGGVGLFDSTKTGIGSRQHRTDTDTDSAILPQAAAVRRMRELVGWGCF